MRGRKPKPTRLKLVEGNPGRRPINGQEPKPPGGLPSCPAHLSPTAKTEWKRLARSLNRIGMLTEIDRAAMAAYCQAYGRWVEAERRLAETPVLLKTPAGYVQQSPWLTVSNKQLELMARFMAELGLTPSSRSRLAIQLPTGRKPWELADRFFDDGDDDDLLAKPWN
jgi:P27 family predicted phage terminase small subunit